MNTLPPAKGKRPKSRPRRKLLRKKRPKRQKKHRQRNRKRPKKPPKSRRKKTSRKRKRQPQRRRKSPNRQRKKRHPKSPKAKRRKSRRRQLLPLRPQGKRKRQRKRQTSRFRHAPRAKGSMLTQEAATLTLKNTMSATSRLLRQTRCATWALQSRKSSRRVSNTGSRACAPPSARRRPKGSRELPPKGRKSSSLSRFPMKSPSASLPQCSR